MKNKLTIALLAAAILVPATMQAQSADTNKPNVAAKPTISPIKAELNAIVKAIMAKANANKGKLTATDLADEIKAFDALIAKNTERSEEMAQVSLMRASLYEQLLNDEATAKKLKAELKENYKDTEIVKRLAKQEIAQAEAKKKQAALAIGNTFPEFQDAKDINGKPLSVAAYKGKVVLIDFWATWCGPCVAELPNVIETYKKHHSDGFEIIGISLDNKRENLDAFLKKNADMTWQQHFDGKGWGNEISSSFGVNSIPFTVLVGPDGKIIGKDLRGEALGEAVAKALKK